MSNNNNIIFPIELKSDADVGYDPEANALYIDVYRSTEEWNQGLRDKPKIKTISIGNCEVFIDVNEDDMIRGIEILLPTKYNNTNNLQQMIENKK